MTPADELIASRRLPSPPERVWAAFTSPAGVAAFWGGSHAVVTEESVALDLRPGGEFKVDTLRFVYVSLAAPHELIFDEPLTGIRTTVSIRADGSGSHLTVHQRRLPPRLRTARAARGLASILGALDHHLQKENRMTTQRATVEEYFDGFRTSDHPRILATLTDDVEWIIHGHRTTKGKTEFDGEIENPAFTGSPVLDVERVLQDGPVVVVTGVGRGTTVEHGPFRFAFNDLFTFRDALISRVDSYVVPLP
ncbi:SRPBCC domain-containing protein [Actinoplanes derwentensis]|uniref:Uncharacterized conserved protein YndB, AHSA1/START domain n=1 Tax=Actinoplanes derwentensis TaxID=113562 RepID=A0A1H1WPB7_9ACTN|nr:SRPBCC domain-containing protein [Actinoplanes derwentensis]GID87051.1 hypothetical protein Ade03nite_59750 [Actinoplanes derwentensis]SDS98206.1 Uncharacterized conserved protein YndB, AHSA1/START domain [Actinoplanes derwentensis]